MKESEYTPEIMWQSKETTPAGDPYMTVKKARNYYYYAERGGRDSIAFILYDKDSGKIGLIYESKPPLDEVFNEKHMKITAFGGSMDMDGKSAEEICQVEVAEESGYEVGIENILCVGTTLVSSQMNQGCVGFFVDVTGIVPGKTEADIQNEAQNEKDPDEFINNKVIWFTDKELMDNNDWKSIWIFSKMFYGAIIQHLEEK